MKKLIAIFLLLFPIIVSAQFNPATMGDYFVATWGSDENTGTDTAHSFATWQKGMETAGPGDTVYIRGGVYYPTGANGVAINANDEGTPIGNDGDSADYVRIFAYPGETPILDCINLLPTQPEGSDGWITGMSLERWNYFHIKGLTVRNAKQPWSGVQGGGISFTGCTNFIMENVTVHDIGGKGFYGSDAFRYQADVGVYYWPEQESIYADTVWFLNCDAFNCCDSLAINIRVPARTDFGNYADGFWWNEQTDRTDTYMNGEYNPGGATAPVTYFEGCRSWFNSDDGYDITASSIVYMNFNIAIRNGYLTGIGEGLRQSISLSTDYNDTLRFHTNNIIVGNLNKGFKFGENGSGYVGTLTYNNFSYLNSIGYAVQRSRYGTPGDVFINNLAYGNTNVTGSDFTLVTNGEDVPEVLYHITNSFRSSYTVSLTGIPDISPERVLSSADFISLDTTELLLARQVDGKLPKFDFGRIPEGSDLVGVGTDVGMSSSPDIGIDWAYIDSAYYGETYGGGSGSIAIYACLLTGSTTTATIDTTAGTIGVTISNHSNKFYQELNLTLPSGATCNVSNGTYINVSSPVTLTITAADEITQKEYTLTVTKAADEARQRKALRPGKTRLINGKIYTY